MIFEPYYLIIATALVLGLIVNTRLSFVMGKRWGLSENDGLGILMFVSGIASGFIVCFATYAALTAGGAFYGIIADVLVIPAMALIWIIVVGGNKVMTRTLAGLLSTVDAVSVDQSSKS